MQGSKRDIAGRFLIFNALLGVMGLAGCASVPAYEQRFVSRPGMVFSDSPVESPSVNLLSQLETGSAVSGGAKAAGCTACR